MPLQNRVLPTGEIVAIPARGSMTGNRGIIHRPGRTLGTARWSHHAWICCTLTWQGRRRQVMTGRNWTELFFLDEAVAMAAGHRPCGYCRRPAYKAFVDAWADATGTRPGAKDMDKVLHPARVQRDRSQVRHMASLNDLPDGAFIYLYQTPHLIWGDELHPYDPAGYKSPVARPKMTDVCVLTPAPMIAALRAGYVPQVTLASER